MNESSMPRSAWLTPSTESARVQRPPRSMSVLVCGGAGYIGSHTCVALVEQGYDVVVLDNFSNSSPDMIVRLAALTGPLRCEHADVRDYAAVRRVLERRHVEAVIHFAALKAVGDSCTRPITYFDNNIAGTITLLRAMRDVGVNNLIFSSSATVYGAPDHCPVAEDAPLRVTNPYGRTKLVMEDLIRDACAAHGDFRAAMLRYFNPVGAHASGIIGEAPRGEPSNLMPYVCQVAAGLRRVLRIFGGDYPTPDGTGRRDFIHVMDLARAHVDALEYLSREQRNLTVNLGTGRAYSVLEVVHAVEDAAGRRVPFEIAPRRPGDVAEVYADPSLAQRLLGWTAQYNLLDMCRDAWRWQAKSTVSTNPVARSG